MYLKRSGKYVLRFTIWILLFSFQHRISAGVQCWSELGQRLGYWQTLKCCSFVKGQLGVGSMAWSFVTLQSHQSRHNWLQCKWTYSVWSIFRRHLIVCRNFATVFATGNLHLESRFDHWWYSERWPYGWIRLLCRNGLKLSERAPSLSQWSSPSAGKIDNSTKMVITICQVIQHSTFWCGRNVKRYLTKDSTCVISVIRNSTISRDSRLINCIASYNSRRAIG